MVTTNEIQKAVQNKLSEADQKELNTIKIRKLMIREVFETLEYEIKLETNTGLSVRTKFPKEHLEECLEGNIAFKYLVGTIEFKIETAIKHGKQEII